MAVTWRIDLRACFLETKQNEEGINRYRSDRFD